MGRITSQAAGLKDGGLALFLKENRGPQERVSALNGLSRVYNILLLLRGLPTEPIKHPRTARLRSLKMYREDLDQLLELFQGKCARVTISDERYRYESFDDMRKHSGSRIDKLDIQGAQPGLHFLVNQSAQVKVTDHTPSTAITFNELRAEEATEEADALFFRIKDFLSAHQEPQVRMRFLVLAIVLAIVAFGGLLLFVSRKEAIGPGDHVPWSLVVGTFGLVISIVPLSVAFNIGNYLTLETKFNSPSFWAKHQDAFAAHAVTATISAVVGGVVVWLVGHFLK